MRAYVIDCGNLVERMRLDAPLPQIHLAVNKNLYYPFGRDQDGELPKNYFEKETYPCLFMSVKRDVGIYAKEDALDFMERALVASPISEKRGFRFSRYRVEAKITPEGNETLIKMILDGINLARKQHGTGGDVYIAEVVAKNIDNFFTSAL